jgi:hypothetical protein
MSFTACYALRRNAAMASCNVEQLSWESPLCAFVTPWFRVQWPGLDSYRMNPILP